MKLTTDQVYALAERLVTLCQPLMGLGHWLIKLEPCRDMEKEHAARTVWDTGSHLATMQINTADYDWTAEREAGCITLPQTIVHELAHLWFGEAQAYAELGRLQRAEAISEGAANAIDSMLENVVDTIASRLVYDGFLKDYVEGDENETKA